MSGGLRGEITGGWRTVLGSSVAMATGVGLFLITSGFFVRPLAASFHWTRGQIGLGASLGLLGIVTTPAAGWLSDRFGVRWVGAFGLLSLAGAYIGLSTMNGQIAVFYGWLAVIHVLGAGASAIVLSRPIAQSFEAFRGAALGFGLALSALVVMLISPGLQTVIAWGDWRAGYVMLACLSGLVGVAAVALLLPAGASRRLVAAPRERRHVLGSALRDERFWLMFVAMLAANLCFGGLLGQLPALLGDRGLSPLDVGVAMSLMSAATVGGRLISGVAMDRLWAPGVASATLVLPIFGLALLLSPHLNVAAAIGAVLLVGSAQGGEATILSFFTARYFGMAAYGAIYGALAIAISLSVAGGAAMFGLVYDWTGKYDAAIVVAGAGLAVAAICLFCTGLARRDLGKARPVQSLTAQDP